MVLELLTLDQYALPLYAFVVEDSSGFSKLYESTFYPLAPYMSLISQPQFFFIPIGKFCPIAHTNSFAWLCVHLDKSGLCLSSSLHLNLWCKTVYHFWCDFFCVNLSFSSSFFTIRSVYSELIETNIILLFYDNRGFLIFIGRDRG